MTQLYDEEVKNRYNHECNVAKAVYVAKYGGDFYIKLSEEEKKEIKEVPEENEMGENKVDKTLEDLISEEVSRDDTESVIEDEFASSTTSYESIQQISVPSDSSQCPQCNAVFTHRKHMLRHVRYSGGKQHLHRSKTLNISFKCCSKCKSRDSFGNCLS